MNWKVFFFSLLILSGGFAVMAAVALGLSWLIENFGVWWFVGGFLGTFIIGVSITAGLTKDIE